MHINPNSEEGRAEFKRLILSNGNDFLFLLKVMQANYKEEIFTQKETKKRDNMFYKIGYITEMISEIENEIVKTKSPKINL